MIAKGVSRRGIAGCPPDSFDGFGAGRDSVDGVVRPARRRYAQVARTAIVFLGVLVLLQHEGIPAEATAYTDRIAATVNGSVILESDVNRYKQPFVRNLVNLPLGVIPPGKRPTDREYLEELIVIQLLDQEAAKKGVTVDDRVLDAAIDSLKKRNDNMTQDSMVMHLALNGLSYPEFRKLMMLQFRLTKLIDGEITKKMPISEEDAQRYFKANRDKIDEKADELLKSLAPPRSPEEMPKPEIPTHEEIFEGGTVKLRQITLKVPAGAKRQEKEKAQAIGKRIFGEVQTGADFGKLAQQYSQDALAKKGGDLGTMNYKDMVPGLQKLVQRMKPGEVTPPLGMGEQIVLFYLEDAKGRHSKKVPIPEKQRKLMEERLKQEYGRRADQMGPQTQGASKAPKTMKPRVEDKSGASDTSDNVIAKAGILTPEEIQEYKKVNDKVMFILKTEKAQDKIKEWIGQLRKDSIIEVKL